MLSHAFAGNAATPDGRVSTPRVLVVDDEESVRRVTERTLRSFGYDVEVARDGIEALAKLKLDIDLVLLDATMPNLDGYDVAQRIREGSECADVPIIMVTGLNGTAARLRAVAVGVNDFITKPVYVEELRLRTASLLKLKAAHDAIRIHGEELERTVERRTRDLRVALENIVVAQRETYEAHLDTIHRLMVAAESRDRDTGRHIERIGRYSELLARGMGLAPSEVELMRHASAMHDVGKIGIPDSILLKSGKLTDDEWQIMKRHTIIGAQMLRGSPSAVIRAGEEIALAHHERWDGSGYPHGIAGEDIPVPARICAIADVFDALTNNRHYRDALPNRTVYEMMEAQGERHFDPQILKLFLKRRSEVEEIQRIYSEVGNGK